MFRVGNYGTIWKVIEDGGWFMKVSFSTSKRIKDSNPPEYDTDFSSFVTLYGDAYKKAKETIGLKGRDRIKILDCGTTNKYDKKTGQTYTNHALLDWEPAGARGEDPVQDKAETKAPAKEDEDDDELPF